jgi:hypothetical protein
MHKPVVRRPKLCPSNQTIIKQTKRIPRHKRNAFAIKCLAARFDTLDKCGIGLLISGFNVGPWFLGVTSDVTDGPFGEVSWDMS